MLMIIAWTVVIVVMQVLKYYGMYAFAYVIPSPIMTIFVVSVCDIVSVIALKSRKEIIEERRIEKIYGALHL